MVFLLALLGFLGLLRTSTAVRNLLTVSQYRQQGATAVGSIVNTREDHSGEWRGDSYYALVQFSVDGRQYQKWAQLTRQRGIQMSRDSPVGLAVEVVYPSGNPERFLINSDMFERAYRFDVDSPYRQHAVGLLVGMALLTTAIVGVAVSMAGETASPSESTPSDSSSAARDAAKDACGDGTMTSDDLESYKAALESLGINPSDPGLPRVALMMECEATLGDLETWLPAGSTANSDTALVGVVSVAAKDACGDGTMTSDDLESYKAALESLGISLTEGWLRPILMIECGASSEDMETWLSETGWEEP